MNKRVCLAAMIFLSGCASLPPLAVRNLGSAARSQVILVKSDARHPQFVRLSLWQFDKGRWQRVYGGIRAVVGRNGLAQPGHKKEGDGHTPSGTYDLGPAFGYSPSIKTDLVYRQAGKDDFWVDDPDSAQYNQWVQGPPLAKSYEKLRRDDNLYKLAIVVQYNTVPVVPGDGSAIFMHIWRRYDHPTAGCIAVSERDLGRILRHLNKSHHPIIVLEKGAGNG